jgi:hypothetical protein
MLTTIISVCSAYTTKQPSSCLTPTELKDHARQTVESTLRASLSGFNVPIAIVMQLRTLLERGWAGKGQG